MTMKKLLKHLQIVYQISVSLMYLKPNKQQIDFFFLRKEYVVLLLFIASGILCPLWEE